MKSLAVLVGLTLFLVAVQARHYTDRIENEKHQDDSLTENVESERDYRGGQMRHRRKRWQMNYGYDYPPPPNPYYPERRDSQEIMPQIWKLLDEISAYVKRPPPPMLPQPIYVPYPVPYPVPQNCTCNVQVTPDLKNRISDLVDPNQNWGIAGNTNDESDYEDDGGDGSRPISFEPIKAKTPPQRPQPQVDHESDSTASIQKDERVPTVSRVTATCNATILSCCSLPSKQQQKACFTKNGCAMTYSKRNGCSPQSIQSALEAFRQNYAPLSN